MIKFVKKAIKTIGSTLTKIFKSGKTSKYKNHQSKLAKTLLKTAVGRETAEERASKQRIPSADTMLRQIHSIGEGSSLIKSMNKKLISSFKQRRLLPNRPKIAIDFKDVGYFGKLNSFEIVGNNQVKGTDKVIRKAVLSLVESKKSFVIACKRVFQFEKKTRILDYLLDEALKYFSKLGLILVDRAFFTGEVIKLFIQRKLKFLMLAVRNRKIKRLVKEFESGNIPQIIDYEMGDAKFKLFFVRKVIEGKQRILTFATNIKDFVPELLAKEYPKRWLIETCHREVDKFRIRTTSNDMRMRYFYYLLACLLYNLWIYLRLFVESVYGKTLRGYKFRTVANKILFDRLRCSENLSNLLC